MPTVGRCATAREARPRSHPRFAPCRPGLRSGSCARGAKAAVVTQPSWPSSSSTTRSWPTSQSLAVPSPLALTSRPPSWLKARSDIGPVWPVRVASGRPEATAQTRTVPFSSPVATRLPSAVKAADSAAPPASGSRCSARPVLESQITAASRPPSKLPERMRGLAPGPTARGPIGPARGRMIGPGAPEPASHNLTVPSSPAVTIVSPSAVNARLVIQSWWPFSTASCLSVSTSQIRAVPS